jgi:hypothetical protein
MNAENPNTSSMSDQGESSLRWISMVTGIPELPTGATGHLDSALEHLAEWWKASEEKISRFIPELPEEFRTTRIWRQIKFVENYSLRLKPIFAEMQAASHSSNGIVDRLKCVFSEEEIRLNKWKASLENLEALRRWFPAFSSAREYLLVAFPLDVEHVDTLRQSLIRSIRDPYPFLEAGTRERFDESFLKFKKSYIENYSTLHEQMRNAIRDVKKEESKVDPVALHNLSLLSRLQYTDKSYLNRINILANWIKRNQCTLPVAHILEHYPRCYCNFNPCSIRHPAGPVDQINGMVHEGIQYFRSVLDACSDKIETEAKAQSLDKTVIEQVEAFLGNGTPFPLKEQTIEGVNQIIRKNPMYFYSKILSYADAR